MWSGPRADYSIFCFPFAAVSSPLLLQATIVASATTTEATEVPISAAQTPDNAPMLEICVERTPSPTM